MVSHCKICKFEEKFQVKKKTCQMKWVWNTKFFEKKLQKKLYNFWFELFQINLSTDSEPQENFDWEEALISSNFNQL